MKKSANSQKQIINLSLMQKLKQFMSWILNDKKRTMVAVISFSLIIFIIYKLIAPKKSSIQYTTATVEKGTIVSTISASGNIISSNINNITTQASGTVKKVYVNDGDKVSKGQIIAEIDLDTQGAQNYAQAYSTYLGAQIGLNSANNNYRSAQASAEKVLDEVKGHDSDETFAQKETRTKAEVARDNAYDSLRLAQAKLNSAALDFQTNTPVIRAPVSGTITSVTIAEGMNLGTSESASGSRANQRIATIATEGTPVASFNISEIDVSKIKPQQVATITLDSITDKTFTGKVVSVDRIGTTTSNVTNYPVIIKFDTQSSEILPNMAVTANIILETKSDILMIPSTAVKTQDNQKLVTVLKNKKQEIVSIETGLTSDSQTEITSGLNEGDTVIISQIASTTQNGSTRSVFGGSTFGGAGRLIGR